MKNFAWSVIQLTIIVAVMLALDGAWVRETMIGPFIMVCIAVSCAFGVTALAELKE